MEKEKIERAAIDYVEQHYPNYHPFKKHDISLFAQGAQWRINSVWHAPYDTPEPEKDCLVLYKDGDGNACTRIDWRSEYEWVNACHYDKVLRWAYISELLPEERKEAEP